MTTATKRAESKAKSTAAAITEAATDTIGQSLEAAQETATQAAEHAKQVTEQAGDEVRKLADSGTKFVRENPGMAVAGAVGVGLLLGLALRSRD